MAKNIEVTRTTGCPDGISNRSILEAVTFVRNLYQSR